MLAREIGDPEILANADINLALNHLALGDPEQAAAHLVPIEEALSGRATRGCAGATGSTR